MYQYENASGIAWNSRFAGEPCLPHGIKGIFITGGASIGTNCVIFQQVTIGENDLPHSKGCGSPTIGNNCYIGAGAKIIGNVRVGNNVVIGANAVVYKDVPDNSVVLFGEQKVVTHEAPLDTRHYSWRGKWTYYSNGKWHPVTDQLILAKLFQSLST
jgi:serine O-acetyltransferase